MANRQAISTIALPRVAPAIRAQAVVAPADPPAPQVHPLVAVGLGLVAGYLVARLVDR
jgi:hypothetical protein